PRVACQWTRPGATFGFTKSADGAERSLSIKVVGASITAPLEKSSLAGLIACGPACAGTAVLVIGPVAGFGGGAGAAASAARDAAGSPVRRSNCLKGRMRILLVHVGSAKAPPCRTMCLVIVHRNSNREQRREV